MVSFVLPEELRMLRENLRRYVDSEMIPVEMESVDGDEFRPGFQEKFQDGMRKLGLWMMDVPEEFGGPGLGLLANPPSFRPRGARPAAPPSWCREASRRTAG